MTMMINEEKLAPYDKDLRIQICDETGKVYKIPVWRFIQKYCRVINKKGQAVEMVLRPAQVDAYIQLCKQHRNGKPMRLDILKARQLGMSTFIAALFFVLTIFQPNQTACIIADKEEHARNLFKKYRFFYNNMPPYIKKILPLIASNAQELIVDYGGGQTSQIRILVAGKNAGRSDTCQYLHLSEVAFWPGEIEDTLTSVLQTVDEENKNSVIILETTANGANEYKDMFDQDVAEDDYYKACFYSWMWDPDYTEKTYVIPDEDLLDWQIEMKKRYGLDNQQVGWYKTKWKEFHKNWDKLKQEFPSNSVEAFITSGNPVFNLNLIIERKQVALNTSHRRGEFSFIKRVSQDGRATDIAHISFQDSSNGSVRIYEEPISSHPYVVSCDPANGGEDMFAIQVFDNYTCCQVAVFYSNRVTWMYVAEQMYCLGRYYNNALITCEINTTHALLDFCEQAGYRNLYIKDDTTDFNDKVGSRYGWKTETTNRQTMIDRASDAFLENPMMIRDYETLVQMETFEVINRKPQARSGKHDDLVMAMCGFFWCRHQQKAYPTEIIKERIKTLDELEYRVEQNRRNLNNGVRKRVFTQW